MIQNVLSQDEINALLCDPPLKRTTSNRLEQVLTQEEIDCLLEGWGLEPAKIKPQILNNGDVLSREEIDLLLSSFTKDEEANTKFNKTRSQMHKESILWLERQDVLIRDRSCAPTTKEYENYNDQISAIQNILSNINKIIQLQGE